MYYEVSKWGIAIAWYKLMTCRLRMLWIIALLPDFKNHFIVNLIFHWFVVKSFSKHNLTFFTAVWISHCLAFEALNLNERTYILIQLELKKSRKQKTISTILPIIVVISQTDELCNLPHIQCLTKSKASLRMPSFEP